MTTVQTIGAVVLAWACLGWLIACATGAPRRWFKE